ncbi:MAG: DUF6520 family protein [Bacteroidota bacterium]|nr:DUF6520 family protein [Bacteroidota bacterium]
MKKLKLGIACAVVMALGSAFATKASDNKVFNVGYSQDGSLCNQITTACSTTGSNTCTDGSYQTHVSNSLCSNPFLKRP